MHRTRHTDRRQAILTFFAVTLLVLLQVQLLPQFSVHNPTAADTDKTAISAQYASLPLAFEPNQGQAADGISYLVHHGQATTYFDGANTTTSIGDSHITMSLDGANTPNFAGTDQLESKTNYFIGNDQSKWHSDVPNFKEIVAKNVYPGIDLKYYGTNSQLEHDFIVSPGANPNQIAFNFSGQQNLSLNDDGNLVLKLNETEFVLRAPTSYQETHNSGRKAVRSSFQIDENQLIKISLGDYEATKPLIIDPVLTMVYSTYLGGSGTDGAGPIKTDASGNMYFLIGTTSSNFPTATPFQPVYGGGASGDAGVVKMNPSGSALIYATYLGGSGSDGPRGLQIDSSGNAYIAGTTSSTDFPTSSPFQATYGGGTFDNFVTKLNAAGSALTYSTYLGGSSADQPWDIAVDASGSAYVTGYTQSTNFPTASPYQAANAGSFDAFITRLNAVGSALIYSTYLGGSASEQGHAINLDSAGNIYIIGDTGSTNFPTASPYQAALAGSLDNFLTKMNPAGSVLTYSTYLGGSGDEFPAAAAVDASGNVYIAGGTDSTDYPTSSPLQAAFAGIEDGYVSKLNASGSALVFSTYLGGSSGDGVNDVLVDNNNQAIVTGFTASTNFPTVSPLQAANAGGSDGFVSKFNLTGSSLMYSTYLGGSAGDSCCTIDRGIQGNLYLAGATSSTNFPTVSPLQAANAGGTTDAFIVQLSEDHTVIVTGQIAPTLTFTVGTTTCSMGTFSVAQTQECVHTISASTNATSGYVISYIPTTTLTSGAFTIDAMASQSASTTGTEQFGMNLKANTAAGSNTASNFGADPSGGIGTAMTGYQTANLFKFATAGANIAQATGASATTSYTVSFITNIAVTTEAGLYSTPVTYNIIATY